MIGLGYIGLPTASMLATKGYKVFGCDVNPAVVETINRGDIHIIEQDLDILVRSAVMSGQLSASLEPKPADIYIIAVPTPFKENHKPDISYVESATRALAKHLKAGSLIILESTSPVGTTEKISQWLTELRPDLAIASRDKPISADNPNRVNIAHCPERVLPGHILRELVENDRIIGGIDKESGEKAKEFYQTFAQGELLMTDARTAEMSKLAENTFRDVNIAFANELAMVCETLNINAWELIRLANHHPRVNILQPGPGVGGHCIAVDPWFIVDSAPEQSVLIRKAREINDQKPHLIVEKVTKLAARFKYPVIACLGLSFKANIDDLRESPALQITSDLINKNLGQILIVEPHIDSLPTKLQNWQPEVELSDMNSALSKADIILLLVDHKQFTKVDRRLLENKIVIDTRGIWEPVSN
jgi:UDP-N-acetyl-D-mannosaminuronic acid dehydrogenase